MFNSEIERKNLDTKVKFNSTIKEKTLLEALNYLCKKIDLINKIQEATIPSTVRESVLASIIDNNGGANVMIKSFKTRSELLNGIAEAVETCAKDNKEKVETEVKDKKEKCKDQMPLNEKDCKEKEINEAEIYDNFNTDFKPLFTSIDSMGIDEIIETIAEKIADSEGDFLFEAKDNKRLLQQAINTYGEKIAESTDPVERGNYNNFIQDIIDDRKRNVFGFILESVCNEIYKNDDLKSVYLNEDSKINMEEAMKSSKEIYSVLEMVHSLNIIPLNPDNLPILLKNL